jgi:hypothetical protein
MKYVLICFFLFLLLQACTKEVQIDVPGYEEKLVIDGSIQTGQPPLVILSKSRDIFSPTDQASYLAGFVSGAIVRVSNGTTTVQLDEICSDNLPAGTEEFAAQLFGVTVDELADYHLCAYTSFNSAIWGEVGKSYDLLVEVEGVSYTATTSIVSPTTLVKSFWVPDDKFPTYGYSWATLSDPIGQYDAYMWEVKKMNGGANGQTSDLFYTKTYVPVFDDLFFDGLTFDFFYENPMSFQDTLLENKFKGFYRLGDTVVIKLSKMDRSVFKYYEKKYVQLTTAGNPFATPINIPTNISGGALGVWAGFSPSFDTLICYP